MGASQFPGVEVRRGKKQDTLRIVFHWRGVRFREALDLEDTPKNRKYAYGLKLEIEAHIRNGTFDYAATFPNSRNALIQGGSSKSTMGKLLHAYEAMTEKAVTLGNISPSTQEGYRRVIVGHLLPRFGDTPVGQLTAQMLREWIMELGCTAKTVRNILTPLRAVLDDAVNDDVIKTNPLDRVALDRLLAKTAKRSTYEVDPFSAKEMAAILEHAAEPQERNLIQFAFWSGLRTSELIALSWPQIDFVDELVRVRQAVVRRQLKETTKTQAGMRDVMLLPQALAALQAQKAHTFLQGERVFHDARYGRPWGTDSDIKKRWLRILKRAGVRYRNPYQTRHTYASMLLSRGENPLWVAKQMGHVDTEMITRNYGKWIPDPDAKGGYTLKAVW